MTTKTMRRRAELLESAPGPFPWYLQREARELTGQTGRFAWRPLGSDPPFTGAIALHRKHGEIGLIAGMYCWVRAVSGANFLVWHAVDPPPGVPGEARGIRFTLLDADRLGAIPDVHAACARMERRHEPLVFTGGDPVVSTIPTATPNGTSRLALPQAFNAIDELLVLARSTAQPAKDEPAARLRVWVIRPAAGTIEVIPQDWFNKGALDFDYQWVTRIARDPQTGRLIGDGIRLDSFALDATGRELERATDPSRTR